MYVKTIYQTTFILLLKHTSQEKWTVIKLNALDTLFVGHDKEMYPVNRKLQFVMQEICTHNAEAAYQI